MKNLKTFFWLLGLMTVCSTASATGFEAAIAWVGANIPTVLAVAGTAVTVVGQQSAAKDRAALAEAEGRDRQNQANQAADSADAQALQLQQEAGQQRAAGQRRAQEQRRQAAIAGSNVLARTGGGSTDASIMGLTGNIAGEGEYNALTNIYEAEESALGYEGQAGTAKRQASMYRSSGQAAVARGAAQGEAARRAGNLSSAATIFSTGSSLYGKYGGGGPKSAKFDPTWEDL